MNVLAYIDSKDGNFRAYAWPGGYPIFYLCEDNGVLCPDCVNSNVKHIVDATIARDDKQWALAASDANWEDAEMSCDNCGQRIPSAYAEDDVP